MINNPKVAKHDDTIGTGVSALGTALGVVSDTASAAAGESPTLKRR